MGPCCGSSDEEEDDTCVGQPGPAEVRSCTDVIWFLIFLIYLGCFGVLGFEICRHSNIHKILHGRDDTGQFCGLGDMETKPKIYYYKFAFNPATGLLPVKKGTCVKTCPEKGDLIPKGEEKLYVALPTLSVMNRCYPRADSDETPGTTLCVYPKCEKTPEPSKARQICGIDLDDTKDYWLLGKPDKWMQLGWQSVGVAQTKIDKWTKIGEAAATDKKIQAECEVRKVRRVITTDENMKADELQQFISKYVGYVHKATGDLMKHKYVVLLCGLGGSFMLSVVAIIVFAACAKAMLVILIALLFAVLVGMDAVLFVNAGVLTREHAAFILNEQTLNQISVVLNEAKFVGDSKHLQTAAFVGAIILAIIIPILALAMCCMRQTFRICVELMRQAGQTLCEMPSLLLFPFVVFISIAAHGLLLMRVLLGVVTLEESFFTDRLKWETPTIDDMNEARFYLGWTVIFSFLWIFYFHVAVFTVTVSGAVSHWYFYRNDADRNAGTGIHSDGWFFGRPVIVALARVYRYHLGSCAFGALLMATLNTLRLILEYINARTKDSQEANPVLKITVQCLRCFLCCLDRCLQYITTYAYINVSVTGKGFCRSAHAAVILFVKYPIQVTWDGMLTNLLQFTAGCTIPGTMVLVAVYMSGAYLLNSLVIAGLAYMVTRLAVSVYDVCVSALFLCVVRDVEKFEGAYLTEQMAAAMGMSGKKRDTEEIEMS